MTSFVVIWRIEWTDEGPSYRDYLHGPYREPERAIKRMETFKRLLKRHGLEDDWQVSVTEAYPQSYPPTEMVEHLAEMKRLEAQDAAR